VDKREELSRSSYFTQYDDEDENYGDYEDEENGSGNEDEEHDSDNEDEDQGEGED